MSSSMRAPHGAVEPQGETIDPTRAAAAVQRWRRLLSESLGQDPGAALDEPRRMLAMLKVFGSTRRLSDLCLKHPVFAGQAFLDGPSQALAEAARDLTALSGGVGAADALYAALAPIKNRADIAIAVAEISGQWTTARATTARTDLAERLIETALAWLVRGAVNRGELPMALDESAAKGVFALAGGDFAHEDLAPHGPLDILIVYNPEAFDGQARRMAERAFIRIGAELREAFEGKPGDYPIFAVRTPLGNCVNGQGLVESMSRVMAALANPQQDGVKRWCAAARVVAGDRRAGGEFLETAEETIWSRGDLLGENGRAELQKPSDDPRQPFRSSANLLRWSLGRARPFFRTLSAREVFDAAAEAGALPADVAARLSAGAELAQTIVARAQMMKGAAAFGARTPDEEGALASLCNYSDYACLAAAEGGAIADARNALTRLIEGPRADFARFRTAERNPDDVDKLQDLGFRNGAGLSSMIDGWTELCAAGGEVRFSEIAPGLLTAFGETQHPDEAVRLFDRILRIEENGVRNVNSSTRSGVRDGLIDALGCFGAAVEPLTETAESAAVLFEVRGPETPKSGEEWMNRFAPPRSLAGAAAFTRWRREQIGRIALCAAAGDMPFDDAATALYAVHVATLKRLFDEARAAAGGDEPVTLHMFDGPARGVPGYATPIGFIADGGSPDKREAIARDFIDRLGALGDGLFALTPDVSHRPGGIAGALAPDAATFRAYIQSEAVAQDQIMLARARLIAGPEKAASTAGAILRGAVSNPRRAEILLRDLDRARAQRLRRDKAGSPWDLEQSEGGLFDVELIISTLIYRHAGALPALQKSSIEDALDLMARSGVLTAEVAETLKGARAFWTRLATARALARWSDPGREPVRPRFAKLLARAAEVDSFAQVRPIMRGYAEEVTRLYSQLVLGRPSIGLAAAGA
jgi:[glutamine synthetase] adenylyltransferase / [glutamine synthetase]-adenylyl-L-tyrosine phosphorylase